MSRKHASKADTWLELNLIEVRYKAVTLQESRLQQS